MLLEHTLQQNASPNNPMLKLYLLQCYKTLGVGKRSTEVDATLDIKQTQYDSLSYTLLPMLINTGCYKECCLNYASRAMFNLHRCSNSRDESKGATLGSN